MKKLVIQTLAVASLSAQLLVAQEPARTDRSVEPLPRSAPASAPLGYAMSFQQQESAREYLLHRAQEKSESRRLRMEGMRWLGYSPARPTVSTTPFMGHAPTWSAVTVGGYMSYPYWSHPVNFAVPGMVP